MIQGNAKKAFAEVRAEITRADLQHLDPRVKAFVGSTADEKLVGVVYLGYPAADPESDLVERQPLAARVTWIGSQDVTVEV